MASQSKAERQTAKELQRRGVWFREQVLIETPIAKRSVSFVLRSSSGKKLIIDVTRSSGSSGATDQLLKKIDAGMRAAKYAVMRVSDERIERDVRGFVSLIVKQFRPRTIAQYSREIALEMKDIRKMLEGVKMKRLPSPSK
jgi:hypothetical protein